jgi:hypothetical protein
MIFDTLALKAKEASDKELSEITSHDVFNILIDLKDKGMLNFDYELLTSGSGKQFNCPIHTTKHFIREVCQKILGMKTVNEDMVREVEIRLKAYDDTDVVPLETEEYISGHDPTIFFTLSMATSIAFDAGAPYRILGVDWVAGENGVSKQINPQRYENYVLNGIVARLWTNSISPGTTVSIFNSFDIMAGGYAGYTAKMLRIQQWTNSSLVDFSVFAVKVGDVTYRVTGHGTSTIVTDFAPHAADLNLVDATMVGEMFGHLNFTSGLVVSWSKGGGDWD